MVDHYMIFVWYKEVKCPEIQKEKRVRIIETRNLRIYDEESFRNDLSMIDWQTILDPVSENPTAMASIFQGIFEHILDMHAPLKKEST